MSNWLVHRTTEILERTVSRRSFLTRVATVGSALVAAPLTYALKPTSAFAAVCSCSGSTCSCSALCCDGYTEFCCTIYGSNTCPPGTQVAGWWKADGSGFCDVDGVPKPRYYLDCNASCNGCGCGSSGLCSPSCSDGTCQCALGSCNNRKTNCTLFRYGQCGNHIECLGPIVCRVVTCTAPWIWDDSCGTTSRTDNNTRFHDRPCLHDAPDYPALPGVFAAGTWRLATGTGASDPLSVFAFGTLGEIPVTGDWNGDGTVTPGVVRNSRFGRYKDGVMWWRLRNNAGSGEPDYVFSYGKPGDIPIVGDWNGNGIQTPGVIRGNTWYLRNANSTGAADITFQFGEVGDTFVVGDWNGDGIDNPGVVRGTTWLLRNSNSGGASDLSFAFGEPGDQFVVGDWNGDGIDGPGVVRGTTWLLRNDPSAGDPDLIMDLGAEGLPVVWSAGTLAAVPEPVDPTAPRLA